MKIALIVLSMLVLAALTTHGIVRIVDHAVSSQQHTTSRLTGI